MLNKFAMALLALAVTTPLFAQSADQPPTTPAQLTARAYDATSGGIRWQRSRDDRGAVPGYEIARDGTVVGVRDALSYVDTTLRPGVTYTFTVTAVDNAGQRSGTAVTRLTTPGGAGQAAGPAAPAGLRSVVYSATAGALAWTRSATPGLRYEVRRDGAVVATKDGTSYIDRNLAGDGSYAYEVVAIDRQGRRSTASTVTLVTAGTGGTEPTNPSPMPPSGGANPQNLRATVYSSTAAGLVWDRLPVAGYFALRRDGAIVDLGSADHAYTFVDRSLEGNRTYRYELSTLTASGTLVSSITVTTPDGGSGAPTPPPPARLNATTDGAFRATLTWSASTIPDITYEVSGQFGSPVLTTTTATSYVVDDPVVAFGDSYQVVAIDAQGRRSVPSIVFVPGSTFIFNGG